MLSLLDHQITLPPPPSQDPYNTDETVVLIHSLVSRGTAERDGRLKVGDRLVHVNHVSTMNQPMEFAVDQLISLPLGSVAIIGVNHPLPLEMEFNSNPCSPLSRDSLLSEGEGFGDQEDMEDMFFDEGTQSTIVMGNMDPSARHTQEVSGDGGGGEVIKF